MADVDVADLADARAVAAAQGQTYDGTPGDDRFRGTVDNDTFNMADGGSDRVSGSDGDDYFSFGSAFDAGDRVVGGRGFDYLEISGDYRNLTITGSMLTGVEYLYLSSGDVDMTLAVDVVVAVVDLDGGAAGGSRVDASATTNGVAFLSEGGDSRLIGGSGDDVFRTFHNGAHSFTGGDGFDRVSVSSQSVGVVVDLGSRAAQVIGDQIITLRQIEAVTGTRYDDRLTGTDQANWLDGLGGNDVITGFGGDDVLGVGIGASPSPSTSAVADGGRGFDIADFSSNGRATAGVSVSLMLQDTQDTGQGVVQLVSVEGVSGTQFADRIGGGDGANRLYGGLGFDQLSGGGGDDVIYGDALFASQVIVNPQGAISLPPSLFVPDGEGGGDLLDGGTGNDTLIGNGGADTLIGGAGRDRFVFAAPADSGPAAPDTITDFAHGDRIDVRAIDADLGVKGNQAFHFGETPGHVGDIVAAFDAGTNTTVVRFFVDGDATPDMTINLTGNVTLSAADFAL